MAYLTAVTALEEIRVSKCGTRGSDGSRIYDPFRTTIGRNGHVLRDPQCLFSLSPY
jgi:hypothetical protein